MKTVVLMMKQARPVRIIHFKQSTVYAYTMAYATRKIQTQDTNALYFSMILNTVLLSNSMPYIFVGAYKPI